MQPQKEHFKRKIFRLLLFALVITSILIIALLLLQKSVEKHYTTQEEEASESIELYKSADEEYRFIGSKKSVSSIHSNMIPDIKN